MVSPKEWPSKLSLTGIQQRAAELETEWGGASKLLRDLDGWITHTAIFLADLNPEAQRKTPMQVSSAMNDLIEIRMYLKSLLALADETGELMRKYKDRFAR